mgnify:CR=1 FL=1
MPLLRYKRIAAILFCFFGLASCASMTSDKTTKAIPVSWDKGFTMPALLASPGVSLNDIGDLPKLVAASWYAEINVSQTKVGDAVFSSCSDYFDKGQQSTRTVRDSEMDAYMEFKIMCEATRLLINAKPSKESFMQGNLLTIDTPHLWPKDMALQISIAESRRSADDPKIKTWSDATPITQYKSLSETQAIYFHEGGYQEVEVLGNGDANDDGIEDLFLIVRDQVEGGDYFNLRLFVLSVDARGTWMLIKQI